MGKQTLPVTYPTITTFPPYADALAILQSHEESMDWVFSHYIKTCVIEVIDGKEENLRSIMPCFFVDFDNRRAINTVADCIFLNREINPFLNIFEVPNNMVEAVNESYVSFIKKAIDRSMYVYAYCDTSKVQAYNCSDRKSHEVFIYGYDDERQIFQFADFPISSIYKYTFSECCYNEIEDAISSVKDIFVPVVKSICLVEFEAKGPFKFNLDYIKESVVDYLYPTSKTVKQLSDYVDSFVNTGEFMWETETYWGVNTYDYFINAYSKKTVDIRLVHAMYEHKEMMVKRLEYLNKKNYLIVDERHIDDYREIAKDMLKARNLVLKYLGTMNYLSQCQDSYQA